MIEREREIKIILTVKSICSLNHCKSICSYFYCKDQGSNSSATHHPPWGARPGHADEAAVSDPDEAGFVGAELQAGHGQAGERIGTENQPLVAID